MNNSGNSSKIIIPFQSSIENAGDISNHQNMPDTVPVIPIASAVLFPLMVVPFFVVGARAEKAVDAAMSKNNLVFVSAGLSPEGNLVQAEPGDLQKIGAIGVIHRMMRVPTGGVKIMVQGLQRAKSLDMIVHNDGYLVSTVEVIQELMVPTTSRMTAMMKQLNSQFQAAVKLGKQTPPEFVTLAMELQDPGRLADLVASSLDMTPEAAQKVLEEMDPEKRLDAVLRLLAGEIQILELQNKINSDIQEEMDVMQKKHYLQRQLKAIQKELGEDDSLSVEVQDLREKLEKAGLPEAAMKQALTELERLGKMHQDSAESGVIRTYLDWMIKLPWNVSTTDKLDLKNAKKVLDNDHHGLEKVKERILETLAVRKLKPDARSPIICFVGPPGVGKTSLGKSIANALGRKFYRFSVGGVRDESEIRGHRRTYVGAMPGRIINGLKTAGSNNPVFMIDEIDKMGSDFRGDPSSAMLEVLDPEQNSTFTDHYLDVPFDLSGIMFITTANMLHTIPGPLRDRMEVISIEGYTAEEKTAIAKNYLLPRQIEACGLKNSQISFTDSALLRIIEGYTREAGVRNLERKIGAVCRKVATSVASGSKKKFAITPKNIQEYLGSPADSLSKKRPKNEIGVVNGLAWTEVGGDVLHVEAIFTEGRGNLILTGQLGDVMKESARAALSLVQSGKFLGNGNEKPETKGDIHIHVPAGAVPKDGPSAGVTMFTALASLYSGKPVNKDVAMTGEISLRGSVLPIGGLKSKLLAAKREGIKKALVPAANKSDVDEIPKNYLENIEIVYISNVEELLPHVFSAEKPGIKNKPAKKTSKKTG